MRQVLIGLGFVVAGSAASAADLDVTSRLSSINFVDLANCSGDSNIATLSLSEIFAETRSGTCSGTAPSGFPYQGEFLAAQLSGAVSKQRLVSEHQTDITLEEIQAHSQGNGGSAPTLLIENESEFLFTASTTAALQVTANAAATANGNALVTITDLSEPRVLYDSTVDPATVSLTLSPSVTYQLITQANVDTGLSINAQSAQTLANLKLEVDDDLLADFQDNCTEVANAAQVDADGDGIGNLCDADLNNDCVVNVIDLGILRSLFFSSDPVADFNSDGIVNVVDLGILKTRFFIPPGPSGLADICD